MKFERHTALLHEYDIRHDYEGFGFEKRDEYLIERF